MSLAHYRLSLIARNHVAMPPLGGSLLGSLTVAVTALMRVSTYADINVPRTGRRMSSEIYCKLQILLFSCAETLALAAQTQIVDATEGATLMKSSHKVVTWARKEEGPASRKTCGALLYMAPRPGLEPGTYGLTVRRSTD